MAVTDALQLFLQSLEKKSYYEILGVRPDAQADDIQNAFHAFSRLYHPDQYVDSPVEAAAVASDIFKRAVEAYRCLSRPVGRERYDQGLARGRLRMEDGRPSSPPPPAIARTLETLARTPEGQHFATRADRFLAVGSLEEARVELANACRCEPFNTALSERLHLLYEALELASH
jgi:curved DNA-binding protein CbpA